MDAVVAGLKHAVMYLQARVARLVALAAPESVLLPKRVLIGLFVLFLRGAFCYVRAALLAALGAP